MTHDALRMTRGLSRKYESDEDYIGLLLAAKDGYDPVEAILMWNA